MAAPPVRVLLVEDSPSDSRLIQHELARAEGHSFEVAWVGRLGEALAKLHDEPFEVVLLDLGLPDSSGSATFARIQTEYPRLPVVVLTGAADAAAAAEAIRLGVQDYLVKGSTDGPAMARAIRYAIERNKAEEALRRSSRRQELLAETASQLLATKEPLRLVQDLCEKVMHHLDCHVFLNFVVDSAGGCLHLNAYAGVTAAAAKEIERLDFGVAVCGCAALEGRCIVAEDIPNNPDPRTALVKSFGLQAYACHPLKSQDIVLGTLSFGTRSRVRFSGEDLSMMRAVTDLVAIAMQRLKSEEALREADRRKDEFLATLAHELRNPLAPIRNAAHILTLRSAHDPALGRTCEIIERQVSHMARLVEDLLDVSRIERGKIELRKERVDLGRVVTHALEVCRPLVDGRRHRLAVALPEAPLEVDGDPVRLEQMVCNLVSNACKYTPAPGDLGVSVAREGGAAVVRVRDSGLGLAPESLMRVFELFYQVDQSMDRSEGGLGIGLTLVQRLARLHGGTVSAASAGLGKGSEFVLSLPALGPAGTAAPAPMRERAKSSMAMRQKHVLVVDDNPHILESTQMLLEASGFRVSVAADGESAVREALAVHPDAAVVDLGLPGLNGLEVASRIRATLGPDIFLVAVTGYSQLGDRQSTVAAGFDVHLVKPVKPQVLLQVLSQGTNGRPDGQA